MSKLTFRIRQLLDGANGEPGRMKFVDLPNGLRVGVKKNKDTGRLGLYLSRVEAEPGENELETVLNHWPVGRPTTDDPQRRRFAGRHWLYMDVL